jgi:hypothetical protein
VIQLVLRHSDVALIRFTHSPIHELVGSIMTLNDRRRHLMHRRWIAWAEPRVRRQSLELLTAVTPTENTFQTSSHRFSTPHP